MTIKGRQNTRQIVTFDAAPSCLRLLQSKILRTPLYRNTLTKDISEMLGVYFSEHGVVLKRDA